ncbi:hypothetical protein [Litorimonas sp. WD9-15]|uniref:hypothetical protein n=1 Tax=Litorimonas sp. WD9-15 TaxID=3418716 RepID=UPI003CFF8E7E
MPRKYNHRYAARQANLLRAEQARDCLHEMRAKRRSNRRVQTRLEGVARYRHFLNAVENNAVQDAIDIVELRHINIDRAKSGLPPYATMEEALNPPLPPEPVRPPPYKSSDYE